MCTQPAETGLKFFDSQPLCREVTEELPVRDLRFRTDGEGYRPMREEQQAGCGDVGCHEVMYIRAA